MNRTPRTVVVRADRVKTGDHLFLSYAPILGTELTPVGYGDPAVPVASEAHVTLYVGGENPHKIGLSASDLVTILAPLTVWHLRTSDVQALRSPIPDVGDLGTYRALYADVPTRVESVDVDRVTVDLRVTADRGPWRRGELVPAVSVNFLTLRRHNGVTRKPSQPANMRAFTL